MYGFKFEPPYVPIISFIKKVGLMTPTDHNNNECVKFASFIVTVLKCYDHTRLWRDVFSFLFIELSCVFD
jgi:hypothetical protein